MKDREPTVRSRALGEGLRRAMGYAGYNGTQIADKLGWSQGRVSRLLAGKRGGSGYDVSAFLAICGIKGNERERLMALSGDNNRPGWLIQHGPMVPQQVQTLIDHEAKSVAITQFQAALIPALLQTPDYVYAVMTRSANMTQEEIDNRVKALIARQDLIHRSYTPFFTFFLNEHVLRMPIGSPAVMADQLHSLFICGYTSEPDPPRRVDVPRRPRRYGWRFHSPGSRGLQTNRLPRQRDVQPFPRNPDGNPSLPQYLGLT